MFDYHGRVAVITGGSSGLGVLCANALAARGCDVVLAARRFEILDKNAQALREQYGVKAIPVRCDVTKEDQVIAARELVEKEFGRCDILINCAGEGHNDWAIDLALEKWQATIDVCVTGLFLMCREFGKLMREHNYGRIVNVASMLGMIALDSSFGRGISEYSASKGAVINFTRQLANEWAQYGITVNTLSPGFFASEQSPVGQGWFADFINTWCPMKRNGSDHELDAAIIFMTCEENSYMTGNMLSTYQNKVLMTVGINIILAVSLNVATGYLGQLPLGHAGFMAVGAYTCALFTKYSNLPSGVAFVVGLVLACIVAGLFGVLIGIPALRLTGDYLAILTLGFGEIIRITLNNIDDVLGFKLFYGAKGLKNIPKYSNFANVFICVVITCFAIHAMMKSRHGRAVLAIRDNEIAAESCGIQTTYYKVMAFAFSAAFAGLAGGLYACYLGVLDPSTFGFMKSIEILVMVVLGGMGSMLGSILSATVLTILPEATRSFDSYRMVVYSLVLVLMMIFRPGGLLGSYDFSMSRIVEKIMNGELFQKKAKEGKDHE